MARTAIVPNSRSGSILGYPVLRDDPPPRLISNIICQWPGLALCISSIKRLQRFITDNGGNLYGPSFSGIILRGSSQPKYTDRRVRTDLPHVQVNL